MRPPARFSACQTRLLQRLECWVSVSTEQRALCTAGHSKGVAHFPRGKRAADLETDTLVPLDQLNGSETPYGLPNQRSLGLGGRRIDLNGNVGHRADLGDDLPIDRVGAGRKRAQRPRTCLLY